jgi:hypothetical protein
VLLRTRMQRRHSVGGETNRGEQLRLQDILHQIAGDACPHRVTHTFTIGEACEYQHARLHARLAQAPSGLEPIDARHAQIHEHDVRSHSRREANGLITVGGFTDHDDFAVAFGEDHLSPSRTT